jgi:hypothetical protein
MCNPSYPIQAYLRLNSAIILAVLFLVSIKMFYMALLRQGEWCG